MADTTYVPPPRGAFTEEDRDALLKYQGILEESPLSEGEHVRHDIAPPGTRVLQERARVARMHLVQSYGPGLNVLGEDSPGGTGGITGGIRSGRRGATRGAPEGGGRGDPAITDPEAQAAYQGGRGGAPGAGTLSRASGTGPELRPREQPEYGVRVRRPEGIGGGLGRPALDPGQRRLLRGSGGGGDRFARPLAGPAVATIRNRNPMAEDDPVEIGLLRNAVRAEQLRGLGDRLGEGERIKGQDKILDERQQLLGYRQERRDKAEEGDRDSLKTYYQRVRELAKEIPEGSEQPMGHERASAIALNELRAFRPDLVERMGSGSREDQERFAGRVASGMGPTTISEAERLGRERVQIARDAATYERAKDLDEYMSVAAESARMVDVASGRGHAEFTAALGAHMANLRAGRIAFEPGGVYADDPGAYARWKKTALTGQNAIGKALTLFELGDVDPGQMLRLVDDITLEQLIGKDAHPQAVANTQGRGTLIPQLVAPLVDAQAQAVQEGDKDRALALAKVIAKLNKKLPKPSTPGSAVEWYYQGALKLGQMDPRVKAKAGKQVQRDPLSDLLGGVREAGTAAARKIAGPPATKAGRRPWWK